MNTAVTLAVIGAAARLIDNLILQSRLARQNGDITNEQLADIEQAANDSDARRDERVEAARHRLSSEG